MRRFWVVAVALSAVLCAPAVAHDEHEFEPVGEAARWRPGQSGRVLFFALDDDFADCLPLSAPCPADSSSLLLVRATGRSVTWMPEAGELPENAENPASLRAVGVPPSPVDGFRYLVPALDVDGNALSFLPRRFEDGRLVPIAEGDLPAGAARVVPVLAGPALGGAAPSGEVPDRLVERPVAVDAAEVSDAAPVLLVRRASPSRVVFGVRDGERAFVPLVDESGVAVLVRHAGRVGVAVPAGGEDDPIVVSKDETDDDAGESVAVTALRVVLVVALVAAVVTTWRRRRRSSGERGSVP